MIDVRMTYVLVENLNHCGEFGKCRKTDSSVPVTSKNANLTSREKKDKNLKAQRGLRAYQSNITLIG